MSPALLASAPPSLLPRVCDSGAGVLRLPTGALIFIGVYALGTILFFPMSLLTISAGFVWGWLALPLVAAGATVGMAVAFFMSRYILRGWVQQKLRRNRKFAVVDKMIANDGWTIVGLLRLAPMVPFNLLNYALGLTGIR